MGDIESNVDPVLPDTAQSHEKIIRSREHSGLLLQDKIYYSHSGAEPHAHANGIFCIVLAGGCTEVYRNKIRDYTQFSLEFIPPNHLHSLTFSSPISRCLSIEIATPWLEKARDYGLRFGDALQFFGGPLLELFMKVNREFRIGDAASGLTIQGLTSEMLAHVSRLASSERQRPSWLQSAEEFLHAHFSDDFRISLLAEELGVHPAHLSRQFRRYFGCTIGEYVRELRIKRAIIELSHSTTSIATIGAMAGFADQSHFCRVFRMRTGMTPGEFRRNFAADKKATQPSDKSFKTFKTSFD